MPLPNDFFAEFPPVSKADWLARIAKDLKDKPLENLYWQLDEQIKVDPFGHADDFQQSPAPLAGVAIGWEICETVPVGDPAAANAQALEALAGGAESLCFSFETIPDSAAFARLFEDVFLDYIGLHFSGRAVGENPGAFLALLQSLATQRGLSPALLHGSLRYAPANQPGLHDWRYLVDLLDFANQNFPNFRVISVQAELQNELPDQLATMLRNGNLYLEKLAERGVAAENAAAALQFEFEIGKSYFVEIAKFRAFKLLWLNVLRGWNAPLTYPQMTAQFAPAAYSDDIYSNMIRATTMAMSAVLGGAARLTVLPYDAGREAAAQYPQAFGQRIARNVQHLLKMESHLDEVADPAAGSFYIEKLTQQLAEAAWQEFKGAVKS